MASEEHNRDAQAAQTASCPFSELFEGPPEAPDEGSSRVHTGGRKI